MTHHSPPGAWSSFTFGLPGKGAGIDHESAGVDFKAELLVASAKGPGTLKVMPFHAGITSRVKYTLEGKRRKLRNPWKGYKLSEVTRTLTPCVDEYRAGNLTYRIYTPHPEMPDPEKGKSLKDACCPGILMELELDNSGSRKEAYAFVGIAYRGMGDIRWLDRFNSGGLCGVAYSGKWALAAKAVKGKVFTVKDHSIAEYIENGSEVSREEGREGGVLLKAAPGKKGILSCAFGFYRQGTVTQGFEGRYYYTRYFKNVEDVCCHVLSRRAGIKRDSAAFDSKVKKSCPDRKKLELFSQAVRAYYASTQLIESGGKPYYTVNEGCFTWRNTMDLAADHIFWELDRHPWVVRNIMDLFIRRYSYTDRVKFPGKPGKSFPGGMSFTHDMGKYTGYTPKGYSGYEKPGMTECYSYMTAEELLNGIYCFAGYALKTGDMKWAKKRNPVALKLLSSIENREHYDRSKRDGIIRGDSMRCGHGGREITTYDALDRSLLSAQGNLYIVVKTLCSAIILRKFFRMTGSREGVLRAEALAGRVTGSLVKQFDRKKGCFPANLVFRNSESMLAAAAEPAAFLYYFGCGKELDRYGNITELLMRHMLTCLKRGNCIDRRTGGLRLSSASTNSWPSKISLTVFAAAELLGIDFDKRYPSVMRELLYWTQVSGAEATIFDQVSTDTRIMRNGWYYPRIVTSWLLAR